MKQSPFVRLWLKTRLRIMFPKLRLVGLSWALADREGLLDYQTLGYTNKDLRSNAMPDTLYRTGPAASSVTAALLALLRDEGRLSFDDPIIRHIPEFRMKDAQAAQTVTIRDVMGHQTGLRDSEFVRRGRNIGHDEVLRFFAETDSVCQPRQEYCSCLFGYALLGLVIERVSGERYAELARKRLFEPLGMRDSHFGAPEDADHSATGYVTLPDGTRPVNPDVPSGLRPACGLVSTPADLTAWLAFWLRGGQPLISTESMALLLAPIQPVSKRAHLDREVRVFSAGGWRTEAYRGHTLISCGGGGDGFSASLIFLPDRGLGLVLLSNSSGAGRLTPLNYMLSDRLLGLAKVDWFIQFRRYWNFVATPQRELRSALRERARMKEPLPGQPEDYAGLYRHPCGAELNLVYQDGTLTAHIGGAAHRFDHISGQEFALTSAFPERYGVKYAAQAEPGILRLWADTKEILTFIR